MKNLGIRLTRTYGTSGQTLAPAFPLLAFSYYRSGFIRLAGRPLPRRPIPPAFGALLRTEI